MSGFNKELLLRVRSEILAHPTHCDLDFVYGLSYQHGAVAVQFADVRPGCWLSHEIGTTADIAGWVNLLADRKPGGYDEAMRKLGFPEPSDDDLIIAPDVQLALDRYYHRKLSLLHYPAWPDAFRMPYLERRCGNDYKGMAVAIAARIDAFIAEMESEVSNV